MIKRPPSYFQQLLSRYCLALHLCYQPYQVRSLQSPWVLFLALLSTAVQFILPRRRTRTSDEKGGGSLVLWFSGSLASQCHDQGRATSMQFGIGL